MATLTLPDIEDDGRITEEQFEALPEPDLFYFELDDGNPSDPADAIVHQFGNRGGAFQPEDKVELSKLVAE